jgi:hypothetical protein
MRAVTSVAERWCPWSSTAGLIWLGGTLGGLSLLVVGWVLASSDSRVSSEVPPANNAVAGAIVVCATGAGWLRYSSARVTTVRRGALTRLAAAATEARRAPAVNAHLVVLGAGTRRYHRPDCAFVAGRDSESCPIDVARQAGRMPCEACSP